MTAMRFCFKENTGESYCRTRAADRVFETKPCAWTLIKGSQIKRNQREQ
jgi:hypothetical protein